MEHAVTYFVSVLHDMAGVCFPLYDCVLFVQCLHIQVLLHHELGQNKSVWDLLDHSWLYFPDLFLFSERKVRPIPPNDNRKDQRRNENIKENFRFRFRFCPV